MLIKTFENIISEDRLIVDDKILADKSATGNNLSSATSNARKSKFENIDDFETSYLSSHHAHVKDVAKNLGVPIDVDDGSEIVFGASGTEKSIKALNGEHFFTGFTNNTLQAQIISKWLQAICDKYGVPEEEIEMEVSAPWKNNKMYLNYVFKIPNLHTSDILTPLEFKKYADYEETFRLYIRVISELYTKPYLIVLSKSDATESDFMSFYNNNIDNIGSVIETSSGTMYKLDIDAKNYTEIFLSVGCSVMCYAEECVPYIISNVGYSSDSNAANVKSYIKAVIFLAAKDHIRSNENVIRLVSAAKETSVGEANMQRVENFRNIIIQQQDKYHRKYESYMNTMNNILQIDAFKLHTLEVDKEETPNTFNTKLHILKLINVLFDPTISNPNLYENSNYLDNYKYGLSKIINEDSTIASTILTYDEVITTYAANDLNTRLKVYNNHINDTASYLCNNAQTILAKRPDIITENDIIDFWNRCILIYNDDIDVHNIYSTTFWNKNYTFDKTPEALENQPLLPEVIISNGANEEITLWQNKFNNTENIVSTKDYIRDYSIINLDFYISQYISSINNVLEKLEFLSNEEKINICKNNLNSIIDALKATCSELSTAGQQSFSSDENSEGNNNEPVLVTVFSYINEIYGNFYYTDVCDNDEQKDSHIANLFVQSDTTPGLYEQMLDEIYDNVNRDDFTLDDAAIIEAKLTILDNELNNTPTLVDSSQSMPENVHNYKDLIDNAYEELSATYNTSSSTPDITSDSTPSTEENNSDTSSDPSQDPPENTDEEQTEVDDSNDTTESTSSNNPHGTIRPNDQDEQGEVLGLGTSEGFMLFGAATAQGNNDTHLSFATVTDDINGDNDGGGGGGVGGWYPTTSTTTRATTTSKSPIDVTLAPTEFTTTETFDNSNALFKNLYCAHLSESLYIYVESLNEVGTRLKNQGKLFISLDYLDTTHTKSVRRTKNGYEFTKDEMNLTENKWSQTCVSRKKTRHNYNVWRKFTDINDDQFNVAAIAPESMVNKVFDITSNDPKDFIYYKEGIQLLFHTKNIPIPKRYKKYIKSTSKMLSDVFGTSANHSNFPAPLTYLISYKIRAMLRAVVSTDNGNSISTLKCSYDTFTISNRYFKRIEGQDLSTNMHMPSLSNSDTYALVKNIKNGKTPTNLFTKNSFENAYGVCFVVCTSDSSSTYPLDMGEACIYSLPSLSSTYTGEDYKQAPSGKYQDMVVRYSKSPRPKHRKFPKNSNDSTGTSIGDMQQQVEQVLGTTSGVNNTHQPFVVADNNFSQVEDNDNDVEKEYAADIRMSFNEYEYQQNFVLPVKDISPYHYLSSTNYAINDNTEEGNNKFNDYAITSLSTTYNLYCKKEVLKTKDINRGVEVSVLQRDYSIYDGYLYGIPSTPQLYVKCSNSSCNKHRILKPNEVKYALHIDDDSTGERISFEPCACGKGSYTLYNKLKPVEVYAYGNLKNVFSSSIPKDTEFSNTATIFNDAVKRKEKVFTDLFVLPETNSTKTEYFMIDYISKYKEGTDYMVNNNVYNTNLIVLGASLSLYSPEEVLNKDFKTRLENESYILSNGTTITNPVSAEEQCPLYETYDINKSTVHSLQRKRLGIKLHTSSACCDASILEQLPNKNNPIVYVYLKYTITPEQS